MNRAQRRALAATADRAAAIMATSTYDRADDGRLVHVAEPRAQAALRRAFAHVLRHEMRPHVIRLSREEAAAFPHPAEAPPGAGHWLAAGVDRDGRGVFVLRAATMLGDDCPVAERRAAEAMMLAELRPLLAERWAMARR